MLPSCRTRWRNFSERRRRRPGRAASSTWGTAELDWWGVLKVLKMLIRCWRCWFYMCFFLMKYASCIFSSIIWNECVCDLTILDLYCTRMLILCIHALLCSISLRMHWYLAIRGLFLMFWLTRDPTLIPFLVHVSPKYWAVCSYIWRSSWLEWCQSETWMCKQGDALDG